MPKKSREKLLTALSMGFCSLSLCLFLMVLYDGLRTRLHNIPQSPPSLVTNNTAKGRPRQEVPSKDPQLLMRARATEIMDFPKTPLAKIGSFRYQILGLGQNPETGRQVVWIRSLTSNRVDDFAVGQPLFGGPVTITHISLRRLELTFRNQVHQVSLAH